MPSPGIVARVARARRSLEKLRWIASRPYEEYMSDEDLRVLAERYLHILLEAILDLAAFMAARRGIARGPTYRDVVEAVISAGLVPEEAPGTDEEHSRYEGYTCPWLCRDKARYTLRDAEEQP